MSKTGSDWRKCEQDWRDGSQPGDVSQTERDAIQTGDVRRFGGMSDWVDVSQTGKDESDWGSCESDWGILGEMLIRPGDM